MKIWKLVSGILSMILFVFVTFQSCAAGVANTLQDNGELGGTAGIMVSIMLLAGGIVSVVTRKSEGKGGSVATAVLFLLGALTGFTMAGSYGDLTIWAGWCLICGALAIVDIVLKRKNGKKNDVISGGEQ